MSHPLPVPSHSHRSESQSPSTDWPSIEAPPPAHLSSRSSSNVSTRVSTRTSLAFSTRRSLTHVPIRYCSARRCGGCRKGPASTPTRDQPGRGPVLIEEDARDCDCVSVAPAWILSRLVQSVIRPSNRLMINQFLATTDAVSQSLLHFVLFGTYPINYDHPRCLGPISRV